jgi:hypothetical protein
MRRGRLYRKRGIDRWEDAIGLLYYIRKTLGLTMQRVVLDIGRANLSEHVVAMGREVLGRPPRNKPLTITV